jgi:hypothetical protein
MTATQYLWPTVTDIAATFCAVIREELSYEEIVRVNQANADDPNSDICHTHDHCDANQAMLDTWVALTAAPYDSPEAVALQNQAWIEAKRVGFNPRRCRV